MRNQLHENLTQTSDDHLGGKTQENINNLTVYFQNDKRGAKIDMYVKQKH